MKNVAQVMSRFVLRKGWPCTAGRIGGVPLDDDVEVARDQWGIPHITARSMHDLFTAQGWVHAQDRLWQMETLRRISQGTLSEIAGPRAVAVDWFCRMVGMPAMKTRAVEALSDEERGNCQAYADGVNACVRRMGRRLPLEFSSMKISSAPWSTADCASCLPYIAFTQMFGPWADKLLAVTSAGRVTEEEWNDMFPVYPGAALPHDDWFGRSEGLKFGALHPGALSFHLGLTGPHAAAELAQGLLAGSQPGAGSNSWVVARGEDGSPILAVDSGQAFGVGFAQGDFIQHNYHWQDVLSHVSGAHTLKVGYQGWFGDDVEPFEGPYSQPTFTFNNLLTLVQDQPAKESGVMYNPVTGQQQLWSWNAASSTWGLFAEDTWKARKNLTLTLGLRWDDSGNPYSRSASTVFGNFYYGAGQTYDEQIANGYAKATGQALNHAVTDLLSPRVGFAWDINGKGDWVLRGGNGMYNDWLTQANVQEEFRGSPPGEIIPTFFPGGTATAGAPIFELGTGNKPPFGFTYPTLVGGLNSQGGIPGAAFNIGGINPNLQSPRADIWALTLEHRIAGKYVASVGYSGSHSWNIVGNNNAAGIVSYGVDINDLPGDLIANDSNGNYAPTRINHSFGAITYSDNNRYGNYQGVTFDFRGKFTRGFFDVSYTRSSSKDDAGQYPTSIDPAQYYGPSPWDVPNRFSATFNYSLQGLNHGRGAIGILTGGWGLSGTSIFQSGYPFTVVNTAGPNYLMNAAGQYIGYAPGSGDFNADGDNFDYPNVTNYNQGTSKSAFLNGVFTAGQFPDPAFGSEGNEKSNAFREPNFAETDIALYKDNRIWERVNLQLRFEFYNIFNRANLTNVDTNPVDGTFGKALSQQLPRWMQVGAKITF